MGGERGESGGLVVYKGNARFLDLGRDLGADAEIFDRFSVDRTHIRMRFMIEPEGVHGIVADETQGRLEKLSKNVAFLLIQFLEAGKLQTDPFNRESGGAFFAVVEDELFKIRVPFPGAFAKEFFEVGLLRFAKRRKFFGGLRELVELLVLRLLGGGRLRGGGDVGVAPVLTNHPRIVDALFGEEIAQRHKPLDITT